jgi:hypothetical protein
LQGSLSKRMSLPRDDGVGSAAMQKLRIATLKFGTGRLKMALERGTNPKLSQRTRSCEYKPHSPGKRKSAGVAFHGPETLTVTIRSLSPRRTGEARAPAVPKAARKSTCSWTTLRSRLSRTALPASISSRSVCTRVSCPPARNSTSDANDCHGCDTCTPHPPATPQPRECECGWFSHG